MIFTHTNKGWSVSVLDGESRLGHFAITLRQSGTFSIVDEAGKVVGEVVSELRERTPAPPMPYADFMLASKHSGFCNRCDQMVKVTIRGVNFPIAIVNCKACGCGGLDLIAGKCPKNLWPVNLPPEDSTSA